MPAPKQLLEVIGIQTEIAKLGLDLGEVMALVVERTLPLIGADGAAIELAEGGEMVYRAASGIARPQIGLRLDLNTSLSGCCVRRGEILRCDDSEEDPRVDRNACRAVGLRSMIVIPLRHHDATVGVLKAMSSQPAKFSAQDEALLGLLSEAVAAAMFFATKYGTDDLFHMATHDSLTGLATRALFMDRLRNTLVRCARDRQPAGVLMIDMDGLKRINDDFGHRAGDAAIREFGTRIARASRSSDTVARLGGDEVAGRWPGRNRHCASSPAGGNARTVPVRRPRPPAAGQYRRRPLSGRQRRCARPDRRGRSKDVPDQAGEPATQRIVDAALKRTPFRHPPGSARRDRLIQIKPNGQPGPRMRLF